MMFLKTIMATAVLLISVSVLAHTDIKSTFPANEQALTEAPTQLTLTFSGPVRLMKVLMNNSEAEALDIEFKPTAEASKSFNVSLPDLEMGQYLVSWVSMGKDGHKMKGDFSFTVVSEGAGHDN
ncbi:copper resistance CopC family protein [Leucothrix pacifica]|uniref:Copper resistance protein C n=1 Tax=Leucothrix pacifica TaxID=1247513 RepID=A0A317C0V9_9GAMM|nr:copper resistance CopC family protein [Leucothrix pacifica]PWQ92296.1 copper resistance protein CopC [Leucothrix pacifica]